jgi:hypothetical protein
MTTAGWAALAITIFGAFSYGAGSILQAVGARRSTGTVRTLGHPLYLIGVGCDLLAWAGSMIALRELAVYQVQSVLAGSLAVTVVAARIFLASRLRSRDIAATAITIGALTVLAMSAGPEEHVTASANLRLGFCAAALGAVLIGWAATKLAAPGVVAALAGLSLGGAALCGRALTLPPQPLEHPAAAALAVVTEPMAGALLAFAATGMLLYTHALQHGQVGPVTAVLWIGEVIAPSAVALMLLGDAVRPGWNLAAMVAGFVTVGAAVVLATAPAAQPSAETPVALPSGTVLALTTGLSSPDRWAGKLAWWGQPTIWRPPARLNAAVTPPRPVAELTWSPPRQAQSRWFSPRPSGADQIQIPAAGAGQVEIPVAGRRPAALPEPAWLQQLADEADPHAGKFLWSEPPPIWRPSDRTKAV